VLTRALPSLLFPVTVRSGLVLEPSAPIAGRATRVPSWISMTHDFSPISIAFGRSRSKTRPLGINPRISGGPLHRIWHHGYGQGRALRWEGLVKYKERAHQRSTGSKAARIRRFSYFLDQRYTCSTSTRWEIMARSFMNTLNVSTEGSGGAPHP